MKRLHWVVAGAAVLGLGLASCGEAPDLSSPSSDAPALAGRVSGGFLETIDFEGFSAGQIVSTVTGDLGSGPILVRGRNPFLNRNAALIIDSSNPPAWDLDLGTPNQACGGPGVGGNVGPGTQFENCAPLGNVLVIAANLIDQNGDGLVDNPDDFNQTAYPGVLATLDFAALGGVTLQRMTVLDFDGNGPNPRVELMGASGPLGVFPIPNTMPSNGVTVVDLGGTPGVLSMVVYLQGSGGIDNIVFGEEQPPVGEIGDFVWCDLDNDGFQDPGEPGLEGVVVNLTCTFPDGSTLTDSRTTDANGYYLFTGIPAGQCHVEVDVNTAPPGCDVVGQCPVEMDIDLAPGESFLDADFCFRPPPPQLGEIGDFVWCDLNNDGVQDPGEPGLEGVTVNLTCTFPDGSTLNASTTTNANGYYLFTGIPAGICHVAVDVNTAPAGCDAPGQCPVEMDVVLGPGESFLDADFCFRPPPPQLGEIGDFVWCDLNNDGVQDPNEPGLEGVVVNLTCTFPDGSTLNASATTNANGYYLFTGIPTGTCHVAVDVNTAPAGCDQIGQCPTQMDIVLGPGESFLDADFCFWPTPLVPEDCCENGKPAVLTFQYTGEDCSASQNSQGEGKWYCIGDPAFAPIVRILVTDKKTPGDRKEKVFFDGDVLLNGLFDVMAATAGEDHLKSNTFVYVYGPAGNLLQSLKIHTSCSQPLFSGDQFGSMLLIDCCGEDEPGGSNDSCDDGKPQVLTMRYTGEDCSATQTTQDNGKWSCSGDPAFAPTVHIKATDKEDPNSNKAKIWFEGDVPLDGLFDIDATNAGQSRLKSNTWVHITALDGTTLQTVNFHTSCSQPLAVGDQWGSLLLEVFTPEP